MGVRARPGHRGCSRWRGWPSGWAARTRCCRSLKPGARRVQDRHAGGRARADERRRRVRALLLRPRPARDQRLRAGAGRALRPRQDRRRHRRPGALHRGRGASRGASCRRSTPAPGRCTRAARSSTSPTSPTTSCCARSCTTCARAPTIPSTATPSCASRSTSSRQPVVSLATTQLRGGTLGKVRVRLSKISRVGLKFSRAGKVVYLEARGRGGPRDAGARCGACRARRAPTTWRSPPSTWRVTSAPPRVRSTS